MFEAIVSDILKKVSPKIAKKVGESTKKIYWQLRARIANSSHQYDKYYRERHGQIKVFCVGMREPISLDDVYVAVQFLDQETVTKYKSRQNIENTFREDGKQRFQSNSDQRQDGMKVANDKQHLMVLGGPGVGKSTFLRKVGLEALKKKEGNFAHECTPVFLELKKCTGDSVDIEALIADEFKTCAYPRPEQMAKTALKSGKLLVLFDGLDEVPTANVDNVIRKIGDFVDQYSQNRFIASCRIAAYKGGFTRFSEVEIAEFDDSQVEAYINNWFASTSGIHQRQLDQEMKTAEQCWEVLNEEHHEATRKLAQTPLLLALLCMVYNDLRHFPRNRAGLYEKALNVVLKEWATEKGAPQYSSVNQFLDTSTEKRMLSEIAAKNFEANRLFFSEDELVNQIKEFGEKGVSTLSTLDAYKILEAIVVEQGLFVERISGVYSFLHPTFQEYLTANYIVRNLQSIRGLVTGHLHDVRWREVFLLTAELMPKADSLLMEMTVEAAKSINTDRLKALLKWAKCITQPPDDPYNRAAKPTFAIRQFFSLWIFNKVYELVKKIVNRSPDHKPNLNLYQSLNYLQNRVPHQVIWQNLDIYRTLHLALHQTCNLDRSLIIYRNRALYQEYSEDFPGKGFDYYHPLHRDLHQNLQSLDFYLNRDLFLEIYAYVRIYLYLYQTIDFYIHEELHLNLDYYQDLYRHMDGDCYPHVFSRFGEQFEGELNTRMTIIEHMEQAKIFKGVDLQQMVQRFKEQLALITVAREGKSVKLPEASIHDTWLSVLNITDYMLTITPEEMRSYVYYLRAVELTVACKKVAGRVTPEIWKQIEDQFLTYAEREIED